MKLHSFIPFAFLLFLSVVVAYCLANIPTSQEIVLKRRELSKPEDIAEIQSVRKVLQSSEIAAMHSKSKDFLFDFVNKHSDTINMIQNSYIDASRSNQSALKQVLKAVEELINVINDNDGNHNYVLDQVLKYLNQASNTLQASEQLAHDSFSQVDGLQGQIEKEMDGLKKRELERENKWFLTRIVGDIFSGDKGSVTHCFDSLTNVHALTLVCFAIHSFRCWCLTTSVG